MSQRSAGTLALPWSTVSPRTPKRVGMDHILLFVTITLALVGLVMVFSASAVVAGQKRFHDSWYYLKRQLAWLALGLVLLHAASRIDYIWWKRFAFPLLGLIIVLLVVVLIPSVGVSANGARRWLRLGSISIQPAEMAKLIAVIYLAAYLAKKEDRLRQFLDGAAAGAARCRGHQWIGPSGARFGNRCGDWIGHGRACLFLGGARVAHLLRLVPVALVAVAVLIWLSPYRWQRLIAFFDPREGSDGSGVSDQPILFGIRQRGTLRSRVGGEASRNCSFFRKPIPILYWRWSARSWGSLERGSSCFSSPSS